MKEIALKFIEYDYYNLKKAIQILLELGKVRITFFVAFSTAIGFILASGKLSYELIIPTLGVFLLASGASALNHFQERKTDAMMERTKSRPLPSGTVQPNIALVIIISFVAIGSFLLYSSVNITAFALGLLAVFWYNGFYTPLKKITPLAVVPGALIGSIPPMIGWIAGGGGLIDPGMWALAIFFFIWQIPHFWLLLLIYSRDYEQAGFPTLTRLFDADILSKITFLWIAALTASCLLMPLSGVVNNIYAGLLLTASAIWLLWKSKALLLNKSERKIFRYAFRDINTYVLIVVLILAVNRILNF